MCGLSEPGDSLSRRGRQIEHHEIQPRKAIQNYWYTD